MENNVEYKKAQPEMLDEIMRIMTACFGDPIWVIKFFFKEKLSIDSCYICKVNNKIVSVLHVIKSNIKINKESLNGIYIYGACTLKEYRNQGYMTNLIKYVNELYSSKGYDCSYLLPANKDLEKFYSNLGYKNFFKIKTVEFSRTEMMDICKNEDKNIDINQKHSLSFYEMKDLRNEIYDGQCYVYYDEKDLEFSSKLYELFSSGDIVTTGSGYAICGFVSSGELKARDFTSGFNSTVELLKKIYDRFPGQRKYIIETSTSNEFFKDMGTEKYYGMIYPLSDLSAGIIDNVHFLTGIDQNPYFGLSLE